MDRTNASLDATLEGLEPFVAETATEWPEPEPAPLVHDEEELDRTIFAALVSPYV